MISLILILICIIINLVMNYICIVWILTVDTLELKFRESLFETSDLYSAAINGAYD